VGPPEGGYRGPPGARAFPAARGAEGRVNALIDAHAHLTDDRLADDLEAVIARASDAGITRILTCGEDVPSSERAVALVRRWPTVRAAVGTHPHRAASLDDEAIRRLRELAAAPGVVAIGEIGIDLSGRSAPRSEQERAFVAQVELAIDLGMPVCIHVRDAGEAVRRLLDGIGPVQGYVHCYSEGPDEVDDWIRRGLLVSFAGTVTFPRNDALRAAATCVPDDRLLVETDAPYLAPQPQRGRRNEPAFIAATYGVIASARGVTQERLADRVRENAASLFGGRW
jgi:TatD DNase family protein